VITDYPLIFFQFPLHLCYLTAEQKFRITKVMPVKELLSVVY